MSNIEEETHEPDRKSHPGTPRWVKVSGFIGLALVLLFVILHLTGNGFGPSQHIPSTIDNKQGMQP